MSWHWAVCQSPFHLFLSTRQRHTKIQDYPLLVDGDFDSHTRERHKDRFWSKILLNCGRLPSASSRSLLRVRYCLARSVVILFNAQLNSQLKCTRRSLNGTSD